MTPKPVVRVLAAPGRRVVLLTPTGAAAVRRVSSPEGDLRYMQKIGEDGIYDATSGDTPRVPGPVAVALDARIRRLIADGDLVVVVEQKETTR